MKPSARLGGFVGLALLASAAASPARAQDQTALQPYQIVRSLQVVQDRIASGDHAILPMQRKLLEIMDAKLRRAGSADFGDKRNLNALLVYAMSGGNPATIGSVLSRLHLETNERDIGKGILNYLNGQPIEARATLASVDPLAVSPDLGAFLALVKGSVLATESPQAALKLLDLARLLGPGTLVEEGALRRSIAIAATIGDAERFARASTQYSARYLRSPYAPQFADEFVSGVVALNGALDYDAIGSVTALMDAEQERVIYLRIARRAGIDGLAELSTFASAKADDSKRSKGEDPRALLYSSLAAVPSGTSDEINAMLARIDPSRLSKSDQELLDAVRDVAAKLTAKPPALAAGPSAPPEPAAMPEDSEQPVAEAPPEAPSPLAQAAATRPGPGPTKPVVDDAEKIVLETRRKLDEIDRLLGEVQ